MILSRIQDGRAPADSPAWLRAWTVLPLFLIALPLIYVAIRTSQSGLGGLARELLRERTAMLLVNTVVLALGVTVTAGLIGLSVAWCVERTTLPGRKVWRVAAALPLTVPAFVSSYAWSSLDVIFQGMAGAILILSLSSYPLVYLPVSAALKAVDPAFEDISRSLGYGPFRTFVRALLPQLTPALGGGALLVLTHMLAEFGALALLRVQTFTTAIFESYELQFDNASAAALSLVLMALCIPAAYAEMRVRGRRSVARISRGAVRQPPLVSLGKLNLVALAGFAVLMILALGVPVATLIYWLLHGQSLGKGYSAISQAILGSLQLGASGALFTALLALPLVLLSIRYRSRLSVFADRLPYIIHGLPGVVVALALVFFSIRVVPYLYQSQLVLLFAYAILFLPMAQSSLRASIELVPAQLEPIARSLGRNPFQVFLSIIVPNITPGIGAALALMMLEIFRELTATLMLAPTGTKTLATEIWSYTFDAEYAAAAPYAALLVIVSILPVAIFTKRMLRQGAER